VQDCLAEHGAALDLAERSGNAEAKVRALGGLGDAEYALGHMIGCGRWFERCVAESRRIGLGRVEVSNLAMLGFSLDHALALGRALAVGEEAIALSAAVGQIRAEMIARHLCVLALLDLGRAAEARPHVERASAIARELEAWRFEAENQALLAEIELECGRRDAARAAAEAAVGHARATSMGFWGPAALAVAARLADDRAARGALAAEAHALLAGQVLAHNQHIARRHLIEMALADGDPDTAEDHAARLDAFYRAEPTPLASFIARRARVLAAALRGTPSPALAAEAQALLDEAAAAGAALLARGLPEARDRLLASGTARLP
jgi:hypothetical protein